tara:strand:- start:302 stop:2095 length:1794 start_codon:yes stop_codon:yes gene_type:complete
MAEKIIIDLEAKTDAAVNEIKELKKQIEVLNKEIADGNKQTKDGLADVEKASQKTAKGVKGIAVGLGALGVGLVVAAFKKLVEVFNENQVAIDLFNTAFEVVSIAFNDVVKLFSNNINLIRDFLKALFEDPIETIGNFKDAIIDGAINRFKELFEALTFVAKGIGDLFLGNFSNAIENFKQAGKESVDAITGQDKSFEQVTETVKNYTTETIKNAKEIVKANKEAAKAEAINRGLIESFDIQAEKLRQTRDEERNTIADRIQANNDLKAVLEEQAETMKANAQAVVDAAQIQFDKNNSDANAIALQEAKNELMAVEAQVTGFMSEQKMNDLALERERLELEQSNIDATVERQKLERDFTAEQIEDDVLRLEQQKKNIEIEKELELQRLQNKRDSFTEGTQAFQDAENERLAFVQEADQRFLELDKELSDAKVKVQEKENADKKKLVEENAVNVTNALGQVAGIVGANSKFGKGIAVVSAIRDTYAGANKALAQGGIFGIIQAVAIIAAGLANVKNITATEDPPTPSFASGGGVGGSGVSIPTPQAPAFNIVGSDPQNQLAQTLAETTGKPVKAFVVAGDVSTAQSLDRNIIQESALG